MLRRHRSTGECFGCQLAQLKVIPKKGLGVGMLDLEMLRVAAFSWRADFVQPSRSAIHARTDAVVAIAPVAAAKAKAPPVAVDVPAPWSDRQAGIGEPLIAGGVDAAIDFAPQPYRTWLASAGGPFDWARTGPAPHISTTAIVRLTTTGRKPDP